MRDRITKSRPLGLLSLCWMGISTALSGSSASADQALTTAMFTPIAVSKTLSFDVLLKDKVIGNHTYTLTPADDQNVQVSQQANYDIKVLFVSVFSYQHEAQEVWRGPCLDTFSSSTVSGDSTFILTSTNTRAPSDTQPLTLARRTRDEKLVEDEVTHLPCTATFAYWDLQRLDRDQLMNSQTGELQPVSLTPIGPQPMPSAARDSATVMDSYVLETETVPIQLWYHPDGTWLALSTETRGGRLTYVNQMLR